jgi:TPR repeat protein
MLRAGVITSGTLAWTSGFAGWEPLRGVLGQATPPPIPPVITPDHDSPSASNEPNSSVPEKAAFDRYPLTMTSTPPPLLVQLPVKKSSPRRILLWGLMAVLVAGFAGFLLGPFLAVEKYNDDPLLNALENGFFLGLGLSMLAAYLVAIIVSGLKGKPFCAGIGIVGLLVPGISLWPIVGAIRLAKPDSIWARKYYAEAKMKLSEGRFKKGPSKYSSLPTQNKPPNTPGHPVTAPSGGHSSLWPIVLVIIATLFVVAVGAWFWQAQKHADVVSRKGETESVQQLYNQAANQNNVVAQNNLGVCYDSGQGVMKDEVEAAKWFRKAAERNYAVAEYNLGFYYASGTGVAKDEVEAVKWYRKAAEQGYAPAQNNLGGCYGAGQGVAQDDVAAVKWYQKAAEQGYAPAEANLAACYGQGQGVVQDDFEMLKWFSKAADQNDLTAQCGLGICYATGRGVAKDCVQAYKWYNLAATQGETNAILLRDSITGSMTPDQIAEGQSLSAAFVPQKKTPDSSSSICTAP